jgi:hypothetical protein
MNTTNNSLENALASLPIQFRSKIIGYYLDMKRDFKEGRHDSIKSGKFCETVIRFLQFQITGTFIPFGKKIDSFFDECRKLITSNPNQRTESERIIIPRALAFLYTFRNKRDIGHVGGDVEANKIDLETITRICDWIICELIRIYHKLSLEQAQDLLDSISERNLPDIWEIGDKKRVLNISLDSKEKTLLLLYSESSRNIHAEDLCEWVEYSGFHMFKKRVLIPLHNEKLIEYDQEAQIISLSPKGVMEVEIRRIK